MILETVKTFDKSHEAYLTKTKLESEGIMAVIEDEHMVTLDPLLSNMLGGIKLKVPREQLFKARTIIGVIENKPFTDANNEVITCTNCGSSALEKEAKGLKTFKDYLSFALAALFFVYPIKKQRYHFRCKECHAITEAPELEPNPDA